MRPTTEPFEEEVVFGWVNLDQHAAWRVTRSVEGGKERLAAWAPRHGAGLERRAKRLPDHASDGLF